MLWQPGSDTVKVTTNAGIVGASAPWSALPAHATESNSYGNVTEVISAANNTRDSWGIEVAITITGAPGSASEACCDILIGGATDDVLIPGLLCGYRGNGPMGVAVFYFPIHVPAGLRVAARMSSVRTNMSGRVGVWLYGGGVPPHRVGRKVTAYGAKENNSRGLAVVPAESGGTASVTQMTEASSEDHFYFLPAFQPATDATTTNSGWINIGIGIGASTEQRIGSWWFSKDSSENMVGPVPHMGAWTHVPASTRLTMLASNTSTNDDAYDGLILAVG